jgi:hypothetical protein
MEQKFARRTEFIHSCETEEEALRRAPWAQAVIDCDGGFWAFEEFADSVSFRTDHCEQLTGTVGRYKPSSEG